MRLPSALAAMLLVAPLLVARPLTARADDLAGYSIEVADVSAKVGEPTVLRATLRPRDGVRILSAYNNRVGQLSSFDDGVAFDGKTYPGTAQDGVMVFEVRLHPTKPGTHPINGVFRVGYMEGTDYMAMISLPLMAKVTGTE